MALESIARQPSAASSGPPTGGHRADAPGGHWADAHTTTEAAPTEEAWSTLLAAVRDQSAARLLYCLVLKRGLDVCLALVGLVVLSPLMLLAAIALRLESRAPVVYRQVRVGRYGRPFTIYKFRTMIPDRRRAGVTYTGAERRVRHKSATDPRVTRIGRVLRATSVDELPQLFNVLRGDMSLIGPRPELPQIVERYAPWQHRRHLATPGLTGWWQVSGRSDRPMHENTHLDLYYVENQSAHLDALILVRTLVVLLRRTGAF